MINTIVLIASLLLLFVLIRYVKAYNLNKVKQNLIEIQENEWNYQKYLIRKHYKIELS